MGKESIFHPYQTKKRIKNQQGTLAFIRSIIYSHYWLISDSKDPSEFNQTFLYPGSLKGSAPLVLKSVAVLFGEEVEERKAPPSDKPAPLSLVLK